MEGAELDVLQGMCNVLKDWRPKVVIEVDDSDEARGEEKVTVCREYLQDLRYRTVVLPKSYRDEQWYVRHIVAQPESRPEPGEILGSENR